MSLAAIAVFAYRRPEELSTCLRALEKNLLADRSDVTIFVDGARSAEEESEVLATCQVASAGWRFGSTTVRQSDTNRGLRRSVVSGVSEILGDHTEIVVLEDDTIPSPGFLLFMNENLGLYSESREVQAISGFSYFKSRRLPETYFMPFSETWGWGTWRDLWFNTNFDTRKSLADLERITDGVRGAMIDAASVRGMLRGQIAGTIDSWGVDWLADGLSKGLVTLYPNGSLIENIGHRNGTHTARKRHPRKWDRIETREFVLDIKLRDTAICERATRRLIKFLS